MKHASVSTLQRLAPLLERLRTLGGLVEMRPGVFYRRSKAFPHFQDPSELFVDIRLPLDADFDRLPVSTARQQSSLVANVKRALCSKGLTSS